MIDDDTRPQAVNAALARLSVWLSLVRGGSAGLKAITATRAAMHYALPCRGE
jgi:hypothetical protein